MPSDSQDNIKRLAQELRDERAARVFAEQRLVKADTRAQRAEEKAAVWRRRAEERAERISQLSERRRGWRARLRELLPRAPAIEDDAPAANERRAPTASGQVRPEAASRERVPEHPTVRASMLVTEPGLRDAVMAFDSIDLAEHRDGLHDTDLVVIESSALAEAGADLRAAVDEWLAVEGRQPLLVWDSGSAWTQLTSQADVVWGPQRPLPLSHRQIAEIGHGVDDDEAAHRERALYRREVLTTRSPWVVADEMAAVLGIDVPHRSLTFSGLLMSNRPHMILRAVEQFAAQSYSAKELLVGLHGFDGDESARVRSAIEAIDPSLTLSIEDVPEHVTLGEATDGLAQRSSGELLGKLDDDDVYGPNYVLDSVLAWRATHASVVGKSTHFTHLESSDSLILNSPGHEETFVAGYPNGATLVFPRATWEQVRFPWRPRRVDSIFVRGVRAAGGTIYSGNRYNFVFSRRAEGHTWGTSEASFIVGSVPVSTGLQRDRVFL